MPLEVVFRVMRGGPDAEGISERQFEAARAALPYCHPRLNATFVGEAFRSGRRLSHEERLELLERDPFLNAAPDLDGTAEEVGERDA